MGQEVTELVTKFSFQGSTEPIDDYNSAVATSVATTAKVTAAYIASIGALTAYVSATLEGADALGQLAAETNVSVETMQELGFVASVSGSSIDAVTRSMEGLSRKIGEASKKGSEEFSRLGISVFSASGQLKNADQVLNELRVRFQQLGYTVQQQRDTLQQLEIDPSLLQFLNRSGAEIDSLRKKARDLGVVTTEQTQQIIAFNDSLTMLGFGLKAVNQQVAIAFAPSIRQLSDETIDYLIANKDLIANGLEVFIEVITEAFDALTNIKDVTLDLIDNTIGLENAVKGLIAIFVAIGLKTPIGKLILLVAAIDDVITSLRGGEGLLTDFFDSDIIDFFKDTISEIKQDFEDIINSIQSAITKTRELLGLNTSSAQLVNGTNPATQLPQVAAVSTTGGAVNSNSIVNNFDVKITTSDPLLAGKSLVEELDLEYTASQFQGTR